MTLIPLSAGKNIARPPFQLFNNKTDVIALKNLRSSYLFLHREKESIGCLFELFVELLDGAQSD